MLSIAHLFGIEKRKRNSGFPLFLLYIREQNYKPGSVSDSHLSRRTVAGTLKPPPRDGRASHMSLHGVAPDRVYSGGHSRAVGCALTAPFHPYLTPYGAPKGDMRRYISVALFLKSPSAGVTRYPCPVVPGLSSHGRFSAQMRGCPSQSCLFYFILAEMSNGLQNLSRADIIWE